MGAALGGANKGSTASATSQATGTFTTQATGSLITGCMVFQGTAAATPYTDNKTNSYTQINAEQTVDTTNAAKIRAYYKENALGGAGHATTAATTTAQPITNCAAEFTGILASGALDTSNGGTDTVSPYGDAVSVTPSAGPRLLVAYFGGNSGSNPATQAETQGFTVIAAAQETNGATFWTACIAYKVVTGDGSTSFTAQFTESGASQGGVILAAFKIDPGAFGARRILSPQRFGPYKQLRATRSFTSTPSGEMSATATLVFGQTGAITGPGALTGTATLVFGQSAGLGGSGALAGSSSLTFGQSGALGGIGVLSATGTLTFSQSGTLAASGALLGSATLTFAATATADAPTGSISGTATLTFDQSATIAATGALGGTAPLTLGQSGTLAGSTSLSAAAALTFGQVGALAGNGTLSASASLSFGQSATIDQPPAGSMAGTAALLFGQSGSLDQPPGTGDGGGDLLIRKLRRARV